MLTFKARKQVFTKATRLQRMYQGPQRPVCAQQFAHNSNSCRTMVVLGVKRNI